MALKPCRECKTEVSTEAKTCPKCGVANPTNQTSATAQGCLGCLGVIVLMGIIGSLTSTPETPAEKAAAELDRTKFDVMYTCREAAKSRLKAPSTVNFLGRSDDVVDLGKQKFRITEAFDSQNGFGAMLRGQYTCGLTAEPGGRFKFDAFVIR